MPMVLPTELARGVSPTRLLRSQTGAVPGCHRFDVIAWCHGAVSDWYRRITVAGRSPQVNCG